MASDIGSLSGIQRHGPEYRRLRGDLPPEIPPTRDTAIDTPSPLGQPRGVFLIYANIAFNIWMIVDAIRRRMDYYWFFILLIPLGGWVYFFAVKIHDYDLSRLNLLFNAPPSEKALRKQLDETPSIENKLALGDTLREQGQHEEAIALFEEVLHQDRDEPDALHGLGRCHIARKDSQEAIEHLSRLLKQAPSFGDWEVWFDLAFAHWQAGDKSRAIEVLRQLVETSPRIKHRAILGTYLSRAGEVDMARRELEGAIRDYEQANSFVKRHSGRWVRDARTALKKLG